MEPYLGVTMFPGHSATAGGTVPPRQPLGDERMSDRGMLKAVHGALVDAGFSVGDIGTCEAELVRRLVVQRDRLREAAKRYRKARLGDTTEWMQAEEELVAALACEEKSNG